MRNLHFAVFGILTACLGAGCAHNRAIDDSARVAEAFFETETFVVTARPDRCAEAQREARRSESPVRVLCRDRIEATSFRAGRPMGPGFRSGPGR